MRLFRPWPILFDVVPVATAIGIFGVIYGATATTVMSPSMAIASSLLLFSGAAQFAILGLLDVGATPLAILLGVGVLSLRHLPLAAIMLPRLHSSRPRRSLLALVLIDETVGLAVASSRPAARTLVVVGAAAYAAWVAGTAAGVLGADLLGAAPLAGVVFVILFIGLSGLTCRTGGDLGRAVITGAGAAVLLVVVPEAGAIGVIGVALGVAATVRPGSSGSGTDAYAERTRPAGRSAAASAHVRTRAEEVPR